MSEMVADKHRLFVTRFCQFHGCTPDGKPHTHWWFWDGKRDKPYGGIAKDVDEAGLNAAAYGYGGPGDERDQT